MIPDGTYTAVVDEIEDEMVRLELESQAADTDLYELVVERTQLPEPGREVDAIHTVEIVDEELIDAEYDPQETKRRRTDANERFEQLSRRPPNDE